MTNLWQRLEGRDPERMARYRTYLDFYQGDQWLQRRRAGESRLTVNYARTLVRKSASYLMPRPVSFNVIDRDAASAGAGRTRRAEQALAEVQAANDLATLDFQSAVDSAVLGDGAFKITWDADARQPVVAAVDPQGLWAWWQPGQPSQLMRVVQRYELDAELAGVAFGEATLASDPATRAGRVKVVEDWRPDTRRIEVDGRTVRQGPNPFGWIPYVIYPNLARPHEFWGASDLEDLLEICRELNRRMTTVSRVLEVAGYPITVLENVDGVSDLHLQPGAIWQLPEDSRAYLIDMLQGGGVSLHIDYINLLYRQLHDLSETPRTAFGDSGRSLSGVALEVEIQPLVQKVMRKRRTWDTVYRRRNWMVLDLLERFGGQDFGGLRWTEPIWGEVLPSDREILARTEAQLVTTGIQSRRAAAMKLGDNDPDATWRRVLAERAAFVAEDERGAGNGNDSDGA